LIHISFCPDDEILARLSGSFAPYSVLALEKHYHDEGVIYLRQRVVNVMQSECRVVSQKRDDNLTPVEVRAGMIDPRLAIPVGCKVAFQGSGELTNRNP
jgi:hypothetical protein